MTIWQLPLAKEGGVSFIYGSQSIESQAAMVRRVKIIKLDLFQVIQTYHRDPTLKDVLN